MPERLPYILFTTQIIIAIPAYVLWGMLALWVAKYTKKIPIERIKEHPKYKSQYPLAKLILFFSMSLAYLLAIIVPSLLIIGTIVAAYGYNFWGWYF